MSGHLAIAAVTTAIRWALSDAVASVPGALVTQLRPEKALGKTPCVNVFLYRVQPNPDRRNDDEPVRTPDGRLLRPVSAAYDLFYLISFYGDDDTLEPQRMLASVLTTLHARPVVSPQVVAQAVEAERDGDPGHYLAAFDLSQPMEAVRLSPTPLNLEELSKLWSVFFQTPYTLSVAWEGSVVLLRTDDVPTSSSRAAHVRVHAHAALPPHAGGFTTLDGRAPTVGSRLIIPVRNVDPTSAVVIIQDAQIIPEQATADTLSVVIPAEGVRAGSLTLFVTQGESRSAGLPLVLHPAITTVELTPEQPGDKQGGPKSIPKPARVVVTVTPGVGPDQQVELHLTPVGEPSDRTETFTEGEASVPTTPSFDLALGFPAGRYLVQVQIDGVESAEHLDENGQVTGPYLEVP